jgi:hypothetical protein
VAARPSTRNLPADTLRRRGFLYLDRAEELLAEDDSYGPQAANLAAVASAYFDAARERAAEGTVL